LVRVVRDDAIEAVAADLVERGADLIALTERVLNQGNFDRVVGVRVVEETADVVDGAGTDGAAKAVPTCVASLVRCRMRRLRSRNMLAPTSAITTSKRSWKKAATNSRSSANSNLDRCRLVHGAVIVLREGILPPVEHLSIQGALWHCLPSTI